MIPVIQSDIQIAAEPFPAEVARRTALMQSLWWDCGTDLP